MQPCQNLLPHLSRIEGQIRALKQKMESEHDCGEIVQLALSTTNSFKSFKSKLFEEFIKHELLAGNPLSTQKAADFEQMLKLSKS